MRPKSICPKCNSKKTPSAKACVKCADKKREKAGGWKDGRYVSNPTLYKRMKESERRCKLTSGKFLENDWLIIKNNFGNKCGICKKSETEVEITIDHIIPLNLGGKHSKENIMPLCRSCNSRKKDRILTRKYNYNKSITVFEFNKCFCDFCRNLQMVKAGDEA